MADVRAQKEMRHVSPIIKSIFVAYMLWATILLSRSVWSLVNSEWLASLENETSGSFLTTYLTLTSAFFLGGAVLAWLAQSGRSWARWAFMAFCLSYAIDSLLGTLAVGPFYREVSQTYDYFRGPVSFVIWCYLLGLVWFTRPNNAPNQDAQKPRAC